jgi:hypothetical protein
MWKEMGTAQPEVSEIITWHLLDQLRETTKKPHSWMDGFKICTSTLLNIKRKVNWINHILHRNCLPKPIIEGKTKG